MPELHEPYTRRETDARFDHVLDGIVRVEGAVRALGDKVDKYMEQSQNSAVQIAVLDEKVKVIQSKHDDIVDHHKMQKTWLYSLSAAVAGGYLLSWLLHH